MLQVRDLCAGYGATPVLRGVNLRVSPGEIVVLLGRNGSGRSTTAKALMGWVRASSGSAQWADVSLLGRAPHDIARLGVGYVPEGRDVFPGLTVEQNLLLGCRPQRYGLVHGWSRQERAAFEARKHAVYQQFPALMPRSQTLAGVLSGGEQQMLSLARTSMGQPSLWLIDEPIEGLAPQVVAVVAGFLRDLRSKGAAVLLMEQKLQLASTLADRCLLLGRGRVVFDGAPADLFADRDLRAEWLEI